ncbi:hypothetical protein EBS02_00300 [bacterium]|nr:hypothetical protein [bacterium]
MAVLRPNFGGEKDYSGTDTLEFGFSGASSADFWTSAMVFDFYNATGENSTFSPIYIKMNTTFETTQAQSIDAVSGIYGQPYESGSGLIDKLGSTIGSTLQAVARQAIGGAGAVTGFLASGGQTGRQQIEFLSREVFNSFQQMIYQGPNFRQFSPSFVMRPTSEVEAESMREIIARLKIASSPRMGTLGVALGGITDDEEKLQQGTLRSTAGGEVVSDAALAFTFGYPDMCKISIVLVKGKAETTVKVFQSDFCMIQSVAATYGSQNKLSFFNGKAYPTEVNLQLQLREMVLQTRGNAVREFKGGLSVI